MASPCEVIVDCPDKKTAAQITRVVSKEVKRIEFIWSRYRPGSIIDDINKAGGKAVTLDDETADMLDYAEKLWTLSEKKFDITSGLLRKAWQFDTSDKVPSREQVAELMVLVGWQKAIWVRPQLTLPVDMQLDFGGIGKEYAADRALTLALQVKDVPMLINLGGDLVVNDAHPDGTPWQVGIEQSRLSTMQTHEQRNAIALTKGGIATSGDSQRYLVKDGRRYSHILDATTGWPVEDAPRFVTVAAPHCTLAGMLSTLAILKGRNAGKFLDEQGVKYHVQY